MKRHFFSFLALALIFIGCSVLDSKSDHSQLIGQWQWIQSTGGFGGQTITPDSVGVSEHRFKFNANDTFIFSRADTVVEYGLYQFYHNHEHAILNFEINTNNFFPTRRVKFRGTDTLVLMDECYDCNISTYERVK